MTTTTKHPVTVTGRYTKDASGAWSRDEPGAWDTIKIGALGIFPTITGRGVSLGIPSDITIAGVLSVGFGVIPKGVRVEFLTATHPTDAIAGMIRALFASSRPEDVDRGVALRLRWARRLRRREAREGTTGRRGARST